MLFSKENMLLPILASFTLLYLNEERIEIANIEHQTSLSDLFWQVFLAPCPPKNIKKYKQKGERFLCRNFNKSL
jgi:hypothetical protein